MIFDIKLLISYEYANPAVGGRHLVRMVPMTLETGQTLLSSSLQIKPLPHERLDRTDFFGNQVTEFGFRGAHESVTVSLQARVARDDQARPVRNSVDLAAMAGELEKSRDVRPHSPLHFLAPSPRVPRDAAMTDFARAHMRPGLHRGRDGVGHRTGPVRPYAL